MARPQRVEFPGAVYYVTTKGEGGRSLYLDESDRSSFLEILDEVVERYFWVCHAYCLMDDHYHVVIETLESTLSKGMRQLNGMYTQRFHQRHQETGPLFHGRFRAVLLEKENYLLEMSRYAVLNPVRCGWVANSEDWPWSSFQATAGEVACPGFLDPSWILSRLDHDSERARAIYRTFVDEADADYRPWKQLRRQMFLGSEKFCARFWQNGQKVRPEKAARPPLEKVFSSAIDTAKFVEDAYHGYGYSQQEIAKFLGVHYATISRWLRKQEQKVKQKRTETAAAVR